MKWKETSMQDLLPIALPLFFSNNNRERLFVTSRPSYLQMSILTKMYRATAGFANAATHNGSPGISQGKKRIFFSYFLHFRGTILPLCWCLCVCVCRHLFPTYPSPKAELIHLCSGRAGTKAHIHPALAVSPSLSLSLTHTITHIVPLPAHGPVSFPPAPPPHPSQSVPITPSPALTYLDIVGEIGP